MVFGTKKGLEVEKMPENSEKKNLASAPQKMDKVGAKGKAKSEKSGNKKFFGF